MRSEAEYKDMRKGTDKTAAAKQYRYGVNYIPPRSWLDFWKNFNAVHVEEDFGAIREIGFDHIRLHLRWDLFQPEPGRVDDGALSALAGVMDAARRGGLDSQVTVLNGWMSGPWFLPEVARGKNIITDVATVEAEYAFLAALRPVLNGHSAFMGIDVGNEINVFDTFLQKFSVSEGDVWLKGILTHCEKLFPSGFHVVGVDHQPWFSDTQFSRRALAGYGAATSLHTWAEFTGATRYGLESEECRCLTEYCAELANAYAADPKRPVWIQEFGVIDNWMSEGLFEPFVRASFKSAARCENLWGYTWWCSHEFPFGAVRQYGTINPAECKFGLIDARNRVKPLGRYVGECIADLKKGIGPPPLRTGVGIVIDESRPFDGWVYGKAFADLLRDGAHAKFVLSSKVGDAGYLGTRGICELTRAEA
jgi:endo-1,4-beta-mannosidase